jgi:electron transfer flavoprotein alpha subunit
MKILVHLETRDGIVQPTSFELLAATRSLTTLPSAEVQAVVIGPLASGELDSLGQCARLLHYEHPKLEKYTPEAHALALADAARRTRPDLVLIGYTSVGLDLGPSLAVRTGHALVSYCTRLVAANGLIEAESQLYGGKLVGATRVSLPAILAVVPGSYDETLGRTDGAPAVERNADLPGLDKVGTRYLSENRPDAGAVDLKRSERIVSVGRAIGGADGIGQAEAVAGLINAEIAGSRPVIDAGWLPKVRQVGKSGTRVKPKLYLALGISGAPEHLEGMAASDLIIAVNTDENAPIFGVAHYGATCDLFELLSALEDRLKG